MIRIINYLLHQIQIIGINELIPISANPPADYLIDQFIEITSYKLLTVKQQFQLFC